MKITQRLREGRVLFFLLLSFAFVMPSCKPKEKEDKPQPIAEQPAPQPQNPTECVTKASADNGNIIPGEYLVKFKNDGLNSPDDIVAALDHLHLPKNVVNHIYRGALKVYNMKLNEEQAEKLKNEAAVEAIEPNRIISIASCYTELPAQTTPWGVNRVGSGDGSGKTAWIIDTGIDLDHPDLNVDVVRSKSFLGGSPDDDHGHGTHVAGIIAAKNDQIGVTGVAANASVVALKVMDSGGRGTMANVIDAVNYVSENAKPGDVVNMSLGGDLSDMLDQAVANVANKGIYFAVAAGNEAKDASGESPARINKPNVYTISAMNSEDVFANFSNFGKSVDFCAPGVNIPSTYKDGKYATMSGTSMATPHVAGLLLLKGKNLLTNGFVKNDPDGVADPIAHK